MSHGTGTPCAPSISPSANLGRGLRPVSLFMHGFREASFPLPVSENPISLIANAQKTPFAQMCKGRMSRGTTFSCKALLRISFFCNGKSRNHLLTEALISRFSSECTPPRHSLPDAFFLLWLQQSSSKATFRSCSPR